MIPPSAILCNFTTLISPEMKTSLEQLKPKIFTHLAEFDCPYFEHVVSFYGNQNETREEEVLHMLHLVKITRLVENKPEAELAREVLEFTTFLDVDEEGSWCLGLVS